MRRNVETQEQWEELRQVLDWNHVGPDNKHAVSNLSAYYFGRKPCGSCASALFAALKDLQDFARPQVDAWAAKQVEDFKQANPDA